MVINYIYIFYNDIYRDKVIGSYHLLYGYKWQYIIYIFYNDIWREKMIGSYDLLYGDKWRYIMYIFYIYIIYIGHWETCNFFFSIGDTSG